MTNYEDLNPEMREKVDACKTPEELMALAKAEGMEIPEEQLERIAGGWGDKARTCPECGSTDVIVGGAKQAAAYVCQNCGHTWI